MDRRRLGQAGDESTEGSAVIGLRRIFQQQARP
jgi:hypothetical protein